MNTSTNTSLLLDQEFDIDILSSLKTSLQRDFTDFNEVKDRWAKTFVLRQQELKKSSNKNVVEFLRDWPLYSHTNAKDLVILVILYCYCIMLTTIVF